MFKRSLGIFLGILMIILVPIAESLGYLRIEISFLCTIALFVYLSRQRRKDGRERPGRQSLFASSYMDISVFSRPVQKLILGIGFSMLSFFVYFSFFSPYSDNGDSDLNPQKADEYRQKQKERRETLNKLNKDALKGFRESRDIVDENILKPKAEKVLEDVNAALELADGVEKTQLLDLKAILLHDLGQLTEAEETYGKYVESGGDKVDFPRALYDAELYERAQAALRLVLAKKRPCEAVILESQILFKLGQGEEASERFFDLGTCSYTPHYEELKAQYEEFKASKGK